MKDVGETLETDAAVQMNTMEITAIKWSHAKTTEKWLMEGELHSYLILRPIFNDEPMRTSNTFSNLASL